MEDKKGRYKFTFSGPSYPKETDLLTEHQCLYRCNVSPGGPPWVLHSCIWPLGLLVAPWWRVAKPRFSPPTPVLPNFGRIANKIAGKLVLKWKPPKTSCARGGTICPPPRGRQSPRGPPSRRNVAVLPHAEYVPTLPAAAALRVRAALSKAAWWPWSRDHKTVYLLSC